MWKNAACYMSSDVTCCKIMLGTMDEANIGWENSRLC